LGQCIQKLPHSCGTRDGLQVFEKEDGVYDGFCFSCKTYVKHPYGDGDKPPKVVKRSREEIEEEIAEASTLPFLAAEDRGLAKPALEYYGIRTAYSEKDGKTPNLRYFPYYSKGELQGYKVKLIEQKRMWSIGDLKDVELFGWQQAKTTGNRKLFITEGEEDAVALATIIRRSSKPEYSDRDPAVVSLPHGVSSAATDIQRMLPEINKHFKEIILVFDMDKPGRDACEAVAKVVPNVKVADLPCKDANECLKEGYVKNTFESVMFRSAPPKNSRLIWGRDIHEEAKQQAEWGLSWPWEGMTEATRGIRYGETYYIAAGEKMGKSEVVNALASHLIVEHKLKVMLAKPEEANKKSYKLLVGKVAGRIFHDPRVTFDEEAYEKAGKLVQDNVCMLNLYQHIDWDTLKGDITYAAGQGVKAVFIDPITNLTNRMSSTERNDALMGIAEELAAMSLDLDIVIFIFCHLNKPAKGMTPWDRGGKITTDYFAGSSAMARSCNYAIGLQGNKDPDKDPEDRNMRQLVLLADREFGESGSVNLFWDMKTGLFTEVK
jgi:twinkle protein